jgi:AcrR family transcriptional regulator
MDDVGLRARKRARTREQIVEAALKAIVERGYDATTLDEIAAAADVHKRTLLRYFPSKVHLVLHGHYDALSKFEEALNLRGDTPALEIWREHVITYSRNYVRRGRTGNTRMIAANEPAVTAAYLAIQSQYQELLAKAMCADWGRDPKRDILSKVAAAALIGGNYAVGAMLLEREAYEEIEGAELEVIRLVSESVLRQRDTAP